MPFQLTTSGVKFIRLPWDKAIYGTEKGSDGKSYIFLRKFDFSGIHVDSLSSLASSAFKVFSSGAENDWIIPIKSFHNFDIQRLLKVGHGDGVTRLSNMPVSDWPWISLLNTPNGSWYFSKKRFSVSTALQVTSLAVSLANPMTAVAAFSMFRAKQKFKHGMSQSRGENDPSWIPKVFVHKVWQVSASGDIDEAYNNVSKLLNTNQVWTDWSG